MEEVPEEYWDSEPPKRRRSWRRRLVLAGLTVLVAAAVATWAVTIGPLARHAQQSAMVFEPSSSYNVASSQSAWVNITPPAASPATSTAPAPSVPISSAPAAPASSVSASAETKSAPADAGPCAGESTWTTNPEQPYANLYLSYKVVVGATKSRQCDTVWIFSLTTMPKWVHYAHLGARIEYVSQALTDVPGRAGSPVKVNGRYILWLQVNAPAAGYEAGAPAKEARFRPGDHMASAAYLREFFTQIRDLVFLGSDQHSSFYAFGLDAKDPFNLLTHLNDRNQVEWALKIAHK